MKDILNLEIKRRESFRPFAPFAPSILREAVPEWFETDDDVPFMIQVVPIRSEKRALIPAVTHVDGSGRLQTVTRETNPRSPADRGVRAADRRAGSTPRSTRTSQWCASPGRRWTVSCARRWMCW